MRRIVFVLMVALLGWGAWSKSRPHEPPPEPAPSAEAAPAIRDAGASPGRSGAQFSCDGRTRCSQMHSCEEATYFLHNCPGVQMDGNHDGVPCERQFCH